MNINVYFLVSHLNLIYYYMRQNVCLASVCPYLCMNQQIINDN